MHLHEVIVKVGDVFYAKKKGKVYAFYNELVSGVEAFSQYTKIVTDLDGSQSM